MTEAGSPTHWDQARSGRPCVHRGGRWWASRFDPEGEARKSVEEIEDDVTFVLFTGIGAGYSVEAWSLRYPDLLMVVAEPDPDWYSQVQSFGILRNWGSRGHHVVFLGEDLRALEGFLQRFHIAHVPVVGWRPQDDSAPEWRQCLVDLVRRHSAQSGVNWATSRRFVSRWASNLARNESISQLRPLTALKNAHAGQKALIAAAGPSLTDQLETLISTRKERVLIAVDTAWPVLRERGIHPDYLLVLDGQYWNARHVDALPEPVTKVVTDLTAPPRAFCLAPNRTYVAAVRLAFLRRREEEIWGELGDLPSGGSVATSAWSLALFLGCQSIEFAGLDLAYVQDQVHAVGTQFEERDRRRSTRLRTYGTLSRSRIPRDADHSVRAVDGALVRSDPRLDLYRSWLAQSIAAHPEVRAVNLSSRGSQIPGTLSSLADDKTLSTPSGSPVRGQFLLRKAGPSSHPPFKRLEALTTAEDWPQAWAEVDREASRWWGASRWDAWIGKARALWKAYPSSRTQRLLEKGVQYALEWRVFWESKR